MPLKVYAIDAWEYSGAKQSGLLPLIHKNIHNLHNLHGFVWARPKENPWAFRWIEYQSPQRPLAPLPTRLTRPPSNLLRVNLIVPVASRGFICDLVILGKVKLAFSAGFVRHVYRTRNVSVT